MVVDAGAGRGGEVQDHPPLVSLLGDDSQAGASQSGEWAFREWATDPTSLDLLLQLCCDNVRVSASGWKVQCIHGLSWPHVAYVNAITDTV